MNIHFLIHIYSIFHLGICPAILWTDSLPLYFFVFCRNSAKIVNLLNTGNLSKDIIPHHINLSSITADDYNLVYDLIQKVKEEEFPLGLKPCQIEDELNKVSVMFQSLRQGCQMNGSLNNHVFIFKIIFLGGFFPTSK